MSSHSLEGLLNGLYSQIVGVILRIESEVGQCNCDYPSGAMDRDIYSPCIQKCEMKQAILRNNL